ncbi:MAG TPA: peptidase C25 [Thermoplasmatales archaeon]|nr:peptidase C25 [Thermoplasmatales archaeon]
MKMKGIKLVGVLFILLQIVLSSNLAGLHSGKNSLEIPEISEGDDGIYFLLNFSEPLLYENKNGVNVLMKEADSYLKENGAPSLPICKKTFIFPIGIRIREVRCVPHKLWEIKLNGKVAPAVGYFPLNKKNIEIVFNKNVYNSTNFYPEKWFMYNIGVGLYEGEHVIFLSMEIYPVRYCPSENVIEFAENFEIRIIKEEVNIKTSFNEVYDLLIISPDKFSDEIDRLVEHKENHGIKTKFITTEEIYSTYEGRDSTEKIKYAIKDAIEQWGIKYVLLVGGMKGQRFKWHIPVRYSHLDDNSSWETGYISDLYYADIYKYEDGDIAFDDWDSNGNGIFAEWNKMNKDVLDLYPDVYVGRLPCRNKIEVRIMVNKIIEYENTADDSWFKKMVVIGGDSFPDQEVGTDYIEGQIECDYALSFMESFEHIRIYVEEGDYEFTPENAEEILSQGEGFVYFSGHGNPASWATHPHNDFATWIDFGLKNIMNLNNGNKLPVCIVGGCHNNQFNVSILRIFKEGIWAYYLGEMSPECWGWLFTRNSKGGSIATIGNTGLGYGTIGDGPVDEIPDSEPDGIPDCIQYLGGWLEPHFFEVYSKKGKDILGETWGTAITDYLNQFPIDWSKEWIGERPYTVELVDCKTAQEWVLFGDPSLKIGGY